MYCSIALTSIVVAERAELHKCRIGPRLLVVCRQASATAIQLHIIFLQLCRRHRSRQDSQSSRAQRCAVTFFISLSNRVHKETKNQHKIPSFACSYDTLIHASLSPDQFRTWLHFTSEELDTLKDTNLRGATIDRRRVWEAEWEASHLVRSQSSCSVLKKRAVVLAQGRFFAVLTYLSTTCPRALPSLVQQPDSYRVVIQGADVPMPSPFPGSSPASEHQLPPPPPSPLSPTHRTDAYRP
jgi:hypothetical protein